MIPPAAPIGPPCPAGRSGPGLRWPGAMHYHALCPPSGTARKDPEQHAIAPTRYLRAVGLPPGELHRVAQVAEGGPTG